MSRNAGRLSVQPEWATRLPLQMQSVLFLGARGPDGFAKFHPAKGIVRAYRGTVFLAAKFGRLLEYGEKGDDFMSLDVFASPVAWQMAIEDFLHTIDQLPHHYLLHLLHGAGILAYKHPDPRYRERWLQFYNAKVESMHLLPETEEMLDKRLGDWGEAYWPVEEPLICGKPYEPRPGLVVNCVLPPGHDPKRGFCGGEP